MHPILGFNPSISHTDCTKTRLRGEIPEVTKDKNQRLQNTIKFGNKLKESCDVSRSTSLPNSQFKNYMFILWKFHWVYCICVLKQHVFVSVSISKHHHASIQRIKYILQITVSFQIWFVRSRAIYESNCGIWRPPAGLHDIATEGTTCNWLQRGAKARIGSLLDTIHFPHLEFVLRAKML